MKNKLTSKYISHDINARMDIKMLRLRKKLGAEGYGIFWMLIEILASQDEFKFFLDEIDLISDEIKVSKKKILSVIQDFDLFKIENGYFFSESLNSRLNKYLEKVSKLKSNANKRWKKVDNDNANAMQMQCNCITKDVSIHARTGRATGKSE